MAKDKNATEVKEQPLNDPSSKIEAIKNLIFGDNIAAYNSEFDNVKKDIAAKRQELRDFVEETRRELNEAIDNLSTDINIRITELEDKVADHVDHLEEKKMDRKTLGDLLITMGEKIRK